MIRKPDIAPPRCAKCAIGPIEKELNPKNKSPSIIKGIKYLAFTGKGMNIRYNSELGNNIAKATNTPYRAPEAPTIEALNA
jgi:hypothetical protein